MRRPQQQHDPPPRVAVYARFSTAGQKDSSIEDQVRVCQDYAQRQGWGRIPEERIYADAAISGGTTSRESYQRLVTELAGANGNPPFDVLLVDDFARMVRDYEETGRLTKLVPIWNIRFITARGRIDTDREDFELDMAQDGTMAAYYRKRAAKDTLRGLAGRFLAGYHPGGPIFGYDTDLVLDPTGRKDKQGNVRVIGHKIKADPAQAAVVSRMFADFAAGLTVREIALALTQEEVPKPYAAYEAKTPRAAERQQTPWLPDTVRNILRSPKYMGRWTWCKRKFLKHPDGGRVIARPRKPSEVLEQERPELVLVDEKTWRKVQARLDERADGVLRDLKTGQLRGREQGAPPTRDRGNPWRGLLFCAQCGSPFCVVVSQKNGHRYLSCLRHHNLKGTCPNTGAARYDQMDEALKGALGEYFSDTKLATQRMKKFLAALANERRKLTRDEAEAQAGVAKARLEIENVKGAVLQGSFSPTLAVMLRDAEAKEARWTARLEELTKLREAAPAMVPPADIVRAIHADSLRERQNIYRQLVSRITLQGQRLPGGKKNGTRWEATISPKDNAGIGFPGTVAFGPEGALFPRGLRVDTIIMEKIL